MLRPGNSSHCTEISISSLRHKDGALARKKAVRISECESHCFERSIQEHISKMLSKDGLLEDHLQHLQTMKKTKQRKYHGKARPSMVCDKLLR